MWGRLESCVKCFRTPVCVCELGMPPEAARGAGWWAAGGTMLPHGDELEDDIAQHQQDHNDLRVQAHTGKGHDKKRR